MKGRKELTTKTAARYRRSDRRAKGQILTEFCFSTDYNRAYAAMLLRLYRRARLVQYGGKVIRVVATKRRVKPRGRPRLYGPSVQAAVVNLWRRFGYICGKRLVWVIRSCISSISRDRFLHPSAEVCQALRHISAASIDRLLASARVKVQFKGRSCTRSAGALMTLVPVRTFGDWLGIEPGHVQVDTVAHDGGQASGEYAFSVTFSDICTGWTERRGVQNRAARWVVQALEQMLHAVPFPVSHLHTDNGSEFINRNLYNYCRSRQIQLTRSRAQRKNDNCYVEQKNFDTVRKLVGYARYTSPEALEALNRLYQVQGILQNYILPSQKLLEKKRVGSKLIKHHEPARTPAQRVLAHPRISAAVKAKVRALRARLDPLAVADESLALQRRLLQLADQQRSAPLLSREAP